MVISVVCKGFKTQIQCKFIYITSVWCRMCYLSWYKSSVNIDAISAHNWLVEDNKRTCSALAVDKMGINVTFLLLQKWSIGQLKNRHGEIGIDAVRRNTTISNISIMCDITLMTPPVYGILIPLDFIILLMVQGGINLASNIQQ